MGFIRSLFTIAILAVVGYCGATVPLGERTFFQHVAQIWKTDETQGLVEGVKDQGEPLMERIRRGVQAGVEEARRDDHGGSAGDGDAPFGDDAGGGAAAED